MAALLRMLNLTSEGAEFRYSLITFLKKTLSSYYTKNSPKYISLSNCVNDIHLAPALVKSCLGLYPFVLTFLHISYSSFANILISASSSYHPCCSRARGILCGMLTQFRGYTPTYCMG